MSGSRFGATVSANQVLTTSISESFRDQEWNPSWSLILNLSKTRCMVVYSSLYNIGLHKEINLLHATQTLDMYTVIYILLHKEK